MIIDVLNEIEKFVVEFLKIDRMDNTGYRNALLYIHAICIGSILAYQEEIDNKDEFNKIKENIIKAARGGK
jgi:hypothetical protein